MRGLISVLVLAATLLVAGECLAEPEDFHFVAKLPIGAFVVNGSSIKRTGSMAVAWWTIFLFHDESDGTAFLMTRDEIDCAGDRLRHTNFADYDAMGQSLKFQPAVTDWMSVVPGSNQSVEEQIACRPETLEGDRPLHLETLEMLRTVRTLRDKLQ